jgi:ATP-dependent DNA helicase RecG
MLPCDVLQGVGKKLSEKLSHLGINHVQDLLFHLPFRYQDRTRVHSVEEIVPGEHVVIEGELDSVSTPKVGRTRLLCRLNDETGRVALRFFYVNAFQRQQLQVGKRVRCFGEARFGSQGLEMVHPEYYVMDAEDVLPVEENLTPIYPTTEGLTQHAWKKLTEQALQLLQQGGILHDILPAAILERSKLPPLKDALHFVHRPPKEASVELLVAGKHHTQKRLVFEELLAHRLSLLNLKNAFQVQKAYALQRNHSLTNRFLQALTFSLTHAQLRVTEEIYHDLTRPFPMLRLVQGDVGSGKTVVAALAILQAIENGFQAAVLAPTELLAEQHFKNFQNWFEPLGVKVAMLTGQMKVAARREALQGIATGEIQVVVGTHAIFQKTVEFAKLALIVVDEQHRFGVEQRALLRQKGAYEDHYPHQLIMTATPIPRTLAMSVYADLDYSVIDELPPGRTPVATLVVPESRRQEIFEKIYQACTSGRQAYWVCTLIEESDVLQCQAAENTAAELKSVFPELQIGLIHGRLKSQEKEAVMTAFKKGELHLLVATTVIEVGVDVPNASLMVIENAERLGLAQLHQLRGRVGRGAIASHCVLMYHHLSKIGKERLAVMRETTDGFKIAQRDLELRGPGEVLGTRQTGEMALRIADLVRDSDLLPIVQEAATILEKEYSELIPLLIKRWLKGRENYGHV